MSAYTILVSPLIDLLPDWSPTAFIHQAAIIALVLLCGLIAQQLLRYAGGQVQRHLSKTGEGDRKERLVRAKSLTTVFTASLSVAIWLIVLLTLLQRLGVDIAPFLASAGILGLAISFGSQELIKDVFAGIFFLLENQFNTGDTIQFQDKKGVVVSMSLRTISIVDASGVLHIIRNSQVGVLSRFPAQEAS